MRDYEQEFGYKIQCRRQYGSACTDSSKSQRVMDNLLPQVADRGKCPSDHWPEMLPTLVALIDVENEGIYLKYIENCAIK